MISSFKILPQSAQGWRSELCRITHQATLKQENGLSACIKDAPQPEKGIKGRIPTFSTSSTPSIIMRLTEQTFLWYPWQNPCICISQPPHSNALMPRSSSNKAPKVWWLSSSAIGNDHSFTWVTFWLSLLKILPSSQHFLRPEEFFQWCKLSPRFLLLTLPWTAVSKPGLKCPCNPCPSQEIWSICNPALTGL